MLNTESILRRHTRVTALGSLATLVVGLLAPFTVIAATQDATFELHPHCIENEAGDDKWIFGPIPSPGMVVETREGGVRCTAFEVQDPQTLRTPALRKGDILDIDLVVDNPGKQDIRRVRSWLSYDPNMLEGTLLEINDAFTLITPDEKDFSESEGYAKMEASTEGNGVDDEKIVFARLQFTVKETNAIGTPITFHDTQPGGHSVIMAEEGDDEAYIVKEEPGVLLVTFVAEETPKSEEVDTEENDEAVTDNIENIFDALPKATTVGSDATEEDVIDPELPEDEEEADTNTCLRDEDCDNGVCLAGECREIPAKSPNGASCSVDPDCESGLCGSGVCVPGLSDSEEENLDANASQETRTAFSLLQIRNVRVTTDGSSVFLAWDDLRSSQLKAYNIYYGTTSGRYIQRRTIDKSETSITLRSLPLETRYFFAVRGLSTQDEESAFSQEVSIVVGDPDSSTAPLEAGAITDSPGRNPVGSILDSGGKDVPGETGATSAFLLFFLGCAVVGTAFASRRQISVASIPHE